MTCSRHVRCANPASTAVERAGGPLTCALARRAAGKPAGNVKQVIICLQSLGRHARLEVDFAGPHLAGSDTPRAGASPKSKCAPPVARFRVLRCASADPGAALCPLISPLFPARAFARTRAAATAAVDSRS